MLYVEFSWAGGGGGGLEREWSEGGVQIIILKNMP